jgi:hypothetical protein
MLAHRNSRRFSLRKSIVKLIGITLAFIVLMGNWGTREVPPESFPIAHAAQGDPPLLNARDAQGRLIIPRGQPIQSFDGEIGPEWNDANLLTERPFHDVENESRTFPTRIWIKHDGRDLYFACEVELPSAWNDFWFFIMLDKDGDRSVLTPGANDDYLQVPAKGRAVPRPTDLHYDSAVDRFVPDVNKGGTNDIEGSGREVRSDSRRIFYLIEGKHPLNSGDRFDVAWGVGQTVGFLFGFVGLGGGTGKAAGGDDLTGKNGNPDDVDQGSPSDGFPTVEPIACSSSDPPDPARTVYINQSRPNFGVIIDAKTTGSCRLEFYIFDLKTEMIDETTRKILTPENNKGTFNFIVPSDARLDMTCRGSGGTCTYRIGGFVTVGDISEGCGIRDAKIYENNTGKDIAVTIEGTTSCPVQTFTELLPNGDEDDEEGVSGSSDKRMTKLFSFDVVPGGSIKMFCGPGTGSCNYILAFKRAGTPRSGQVRCGARSQEIYRNNSGGDMDVTVQVTAACPAFVRIKKGGFTQRQFGFRRGTTTTRTITVPNGQTLELECSGSGGDCAYTVIEQLGSLKF